MLTKARTVLTASRITIGLILLWLRYEKTFRYFYVLERPSSYICCPGDTHPTDECKAKGEKRSDDEANNENWKRRNENAFRRDESPDLRVFPVGQYSVNILRFSSSMFLLKISAISSQECTPSPTTPINKAISERAFKMSVSHPTT